MSKPLKEHYQVSTDHGDALRTFDYIEDLEKYCESLERDLYTSDLEIKYRDSELTSLKQEKERLVDLLEDCINGVVDSTKYEKVKNYLSSLSKQNK